MAPRGPRGVARLTQPVGTISLHVYWPSLIPPRPPHSRRTMLVKGREHVQTFSLLPNSKRGHQNDTRPARFKLQRSWGCFFSVPRCHARGRVVRHSGDASRPHAGKPTLCSKATGEQGSSSSRCQVLLLKHASNNYSLANTTTAPRQRTQILYIYTTIWFMFFVRLTTFPVRPPVVQSAHCSVCGPRLGPRRTCGVCEGGLSKTSPC